MVPKTMTVLDGGSFALNLSDNRENPVKISAPSRGARQTLWFAQVYQRPQH